MLSERVLAILYGGKPEKPISPEFLKKANTGIEVWGQKYSQSCSGICSQYLADKKLSYEGGNKFCKHCDAWIKIDKWKCPCCKKQVRGRTRHVSCRRPKRIA